MNTGSEYADFSNLGKTKYYAGTTIAGHFLENFVENTPWIHLDIASTAFEVPGISYLHPHYGTGAGVRLLVDYIMNYKKIIMSPQSVGFFSYQFDTLWCSDKVSSQKLLTYQPQHRNFLLWLNNF